MTKGELYILSKEVTEIEKQLDILDPRHWYESKHIAILENRLSEINSVLSRNTKSLYLKVVVNEQKNQVY